jgi:molybdenum cofactor cytidylyltransferase
MLEARSSTGIAGLLLAAGASTRFQGHKLLHPLPGGTPIAVAAARHLVGALGQCAAVVRPDDDCLIAVLAAEPGLSLVECEVAQQGMGHSIACGVAATDGAQGWVIALGDMPCIGPRTIEGVASALLQGADIVVPVFRGRRGHPVGFARRYGPELCALRGDRGARAVIDRHAARVVYLPSADPSADPSILRDIDTRDDLPLPSGCAGWGVVS